MRIVPLILFIAGLSLTAACITDEVSCVNCNATSTQGSDEDAGADSASDSQRDSASESSSDSGELICCACTCYVVIDPTLGTEEEKEILVSGVNISCESECRDTCEQMNWDIRYHVRIQCSNVDE